MDAFQVARPLAGRSATSTSARGDWTGVGVPPLVSQIGPILGAEVHVALCYYPEDVPVARYDVALYDVDTYAGPPTCEDVSCQVITYGSSVGRDGPTERFRTGTATFTLDDPTGRYTPWRTAAAPSQFAAIRPGIDVEVWVEIGPVSWSRFAGRVVKITDLFETTGHHEVQYDCADYLSLLAAYDGSEQAAQGAGELSGARVRRILDSAGFGRPRRVDAGAVTVQATTLAKNALDEVGMVCDTDLGAAWCDPDGTFIFRDRNGLVADPHYTSVQATFGEVDPELCYQAISLASDTDKIKNVVSIAPEGGTAVTLEDTQSAAMFGPNTYRRFDLIHDDPAQSAVIAQRHLDFYAYAANRIEGFEPIVTLATLPSLLPLGLLWRVQVRRRADGFQVVADLQIEAIKETITATEWTIELTTFSAASVFHVGRYDVDNYDAALYGY